MNINHINLASVKNSESNYNWINNILNIGIDNLIDKWINNKKPFRLVLIEAKKCYICDDNDIETWSEHTDDFSGVYNRNGWIYCKKCAKLVELSKFYYYKNNNILTYTQTSKLRDYKFKFWRVSSNASIHPYIQKDAESFKRLGNTLFINKKNNKKRINIPVSWHYDNYEYNKSIFLANLIYFNRNILGYSLENLDIQDLNIDWIRIINKEYILANCWSELVLILTKNNIPNGVIRNICLFWGGFTSFI